MGEKDQLTFLVVDSDISRLDHDVEFIHGMGHTSVLQAEDGAEAWAMIKNFNVDFIICAMDVPEVNGLALLKIVRSHEDYASIPFMLVAGQVTAKLVVQAGKTGVSDIIVWPFTLDKFQGKVNDIITLDETPQSQEAEKKYKQGLDLMEAGQYDEALKSFESIISVFEHAEIYYNMGYIKSSKGLYEEALKYFRRATQINESYARAYKKMADVYIKLGKQEEAEKYLEQAADIHIQKKEDKEAEEVLQTVTKLQPDTINVFNSLGIIYRRQGRLEEAVEQYEKAVRVHPDDENIYYNLSRVYLALKDFPKAGEALKKALEINPEFGPARELSRAVEMGLTFQA